MSGTTLRAATSRLAWCRWVVLALTCLLPDVAAAQPHWDGDDYLVAHEGYIDVYDHDLTYKASVFNGIFDLNSLAWTPEGWLRTGCDNCIEMADVGPDGPAATVADTYRHIILDDFMGLVGNIAFGPDGSMFVAMTGHGLSTRAVKKYTVGPDSPAGSGHPAEVRAGATVVASWSANSLHYAVTVVPDDTYGYLVWAGTEDFPRVLKPDLSEFPGAEGAILEDDAKTTVSMYYDAETNTVLAGREQFPGPGSNTLVAVELDASTRSIIRRFYLPLEPPFAEPHLINGITRGENGVVVAADSGHGRIHVWDADGTWIRSIDMPENKVGGDPPYGERAAGSIVWAGNRPTPPPVDTTAPTTSISLSPAAPTGASGWYVSPVTVQVSAADEVDGSGVDETRCVAVPDGGSVPGAFGDLPAGCGYAGAGASITTDGVYSIYAGSTDAAGNTEAPLVSAVLRIDRTPPVLTCSATMPEFPLHASGAQVSAFVSDPLSGVSAPEVSVAADTSSAGPKMAVLHGTDRAGNAATVSCAYTVTAEDVPPATAPQPPTITNVVVQGNFVTVQWVPAATGAPADAYLIEAGDGPGRTTVAAYLSPGFSETGLLPQGEYYLRVRALNAAGLSEPSPDVWTVVTGSAAVTGVPVGFEAAVTGTTVQLAWHPSSQGAAPQGYRVEVGTDDFSGANVAVMDLPGSTTSLTVPNVVPGSYVVRVRALTEVGASLPSPSLWIQVGDPAPCAATPTAPVMLTPLVTDHVVSLWWRQQPTPQSFVVQAGSVPGASDLAVLDTGAVSGMSAALSDGQYAVRALADSACGVGPASPDTMVTVGGPVPAAPAGLVAQPGPNAGTVTLSWTPPAGGPPATHYVVEAGLSPGTTLMKFPVGATPTPALTIPGLPSGLTFVARVRAANAGGIGPSSAEIVVTVP